MDRYFKISILVIIACRVLLSFIPSFEMDMNVWKAWTDRLLNLGLSNFYSPDYFSDYPPVYLYYLSLIGNIFKILFGLQNLFTNSFDLFFKNSSLLFDLGSSLIIYKIIRPFSAKWAPLSSLFFLVNPVFLFDNSIWGQNDGVMIFLCLLANYFIFSLKRVYIWAILFTLCVLFKFQALALFPIFGVFLLKNFKIKQIIVSVVIVIATTLITTLPFFSAPNLFASLFDLFQRSSSTYPYTSLYAFNIWAFDGFWISDTRVSLGLTLQTWGIIFYILAMTPIVIKLFKTHGVINYHFASALSFFAFFIFLTRMHERYIVPAFAFLVITLFIKNTAFNLFLYISSSLVTFLNLFYVYYYYNLVYNNHGAGNFFIYQLISQNYLGLSLLNIVIFVILLTNFLRIKDDHPRLS